MFDSYIFQLSGLSIFIIALASYLVFLELGFRLGQRGSKTDRLLPQLSRIQTSILGLLALMLAFTFSMSITRFETRKHLIVEEANAIGTAYLRTKLFDDPYRSDLQNLLRRYLDNRLSFIDVGIEEQKIITLLNQSDEIQLEIWNEVCALAGHDEKLPIVSLMIQSVNELIDLHTKRLEETINRLPDMILYLIYVITGLGLALTGYMAGLDGRRNFIIMFLLAFSFAAVGITIIDLDRPRRGFVKEQSTSLLRLRSSLT